LKIFPSDDGRGSWWFGKLIKTISMAVVLL
jgi:hypothetical protein